MQVPHNAFVLVADGRKALFFRNEGDAEFPNLQVEHAQEHINPADRDQKTDAAGKKPDSQGATSGTTGEIDFHQQGEDRFAAETAKLLQQRAQNGEFDKLIVIAPPRTLGELRKHYHKEVSDRIAGELAKDLTGHPVAEIEKHLIAAD
jgi:protein required for attachment to host cells